MTIEALIEVVPPPEKPHRPFTGPWEPVEASLGTALPDDYKELARLYGRGTFMGLLSVNLPGDRDRRGNLEGELGRAGAMVNYGVPVPYPVWPEPGGLLNIGLTAFNDRLFWLTRGDPAEWRIVVWDRAFQRLETFDCGLTGFLAGLATGEIAPDGFEGRALSSAPRFEPLQGAADLPWWNVPTAQAPRRMRRGIEALAAVVAPPEAPYRAFTGPWARVEAYLGTELPQDYKDFARLYGSGLFLDLIIIDVPCLDDPRLTLETAVRETSHWFGQLRDQRYPLWPRIGGLIKFGFSENGDYLFWLARGPPEDWKVVFWDRGLSEDECFEEFDCGMAEFLAGLADGSIIPRGHRREDLEPIGPIFQPYTDEPEG
jgi:hypothetical protein